MRAHGLRLSCAALPCLAAVAALAQDTAPEGIGSNLLEVAREAEAAAEAGPPLVAVPHSSGESEIFPLLEGVSVAGPAALDSAPAVQDATPVLAGDPVGPDGQIVLQPAPSGDGIESTTAPETVTAAASVPARSAAGDVPATASRDPIELLKGLWREAVASGDTSEGFETWLAAALNPQREVRTVAETQADRTREVASAWKRRTGPVTLGKAGRVVTTFGEAIPVAHCSPLRVCYIELEPGEQLADAPSLGDSARWQMVWKRQGWDPERVVLEIKPSDDAQETNLVIPTDRRLYTITLVNDPDVHTPILAFRWPDSEARAIADEIEQRRAEAVAAEEARAAEAAILAGVTAEEMAHSGVPTESGPRGAELLDFRFKVDGKAAFRPVRVFADGSRTYIDLHPRYRGPLPAIVAGKGEGNAALNTRVSESGSRLVADRVITDVWLQSGRERIRIRRITN